MTDKDKIKEEIERVEQILDDFNKTHNNTIDNGIVSAKKNICKHIKSFIDSLPEEPKKQPKYKVGDIIKGPSNNIFKVKEVLERQYVLHSEYGDELNSINIVDESSCLVEEHNEDLEEEIDRFEDWINNFNQSDYSTSYTVRDIAHHFAEWQKQQMMKDAVEAIVHQGLYSKYVKECDDEALANVLKNHNSGDKVKIIIVKEEQ